MARRIVTQSHWECELAIRRGDRGKTNKMCRGNYISGDLAVRRRIGTAGLTSMALQTNGGGSHICLQGSGYKIVNDTERKEKA